VGYVLGMSDEIRDWLADLRDSDPPEATQVGQALVALMEEGARLGPPLVVTLEGFAWELDLREELDVLYQARIEQMGDLRQHLDEAAALVRDIEQQVAELEAQEAGLADQRWRALQEGKPDAAAEAVNELAVVQAKLAELRRLLPGVVESERQLRSKEQRLQDQVDAFRTRKETLKASYTAAEARREIREAVTALGLDVGADGGPREGAEAPDAEAAARLREVARQIERELGFATDGLIELRPAAPGDGEIRILFAVEPPGTALLIAVLEGREAVREHHDEAVGLSAEVLQQVREGQAPEATAHAFDDARSFLDEFFPGSADEVEAGAAALVARNRARTLAEQRTRLGLTQAQVAQRMGVRQERVSAIERAEPGATEVRTLAGYVEALGGRLEITADFGDERVLLR
jgi:hypothetical protein